MSKCPYCSNLVPEGSLYCGNCLKPIHAQGGAPPTSLPENSMLTAFRVGGGLSGNYHKVLLFNVTDQSMDYVVARSGDVIFELKTFARGTAWYVNCPREENFLTLSFTQGANRFCFRWSLESCPTAKPIVSIGQAFSGEGSLKGVVEGGEIEGNLVDLKGAGEWRGSVEIVYKKPSAGELKPLPLIRTETMESYPPWLLEGVFRRIILFTGSELTIGRHGDCVWRVFARDKTGSIWAMDKAGIHVRLNEGEVEARKHLVHPVSRRHLLCGWNQCGPAVDVQDGFSPQRPSKQGVFYNDPSLGWLCLGRKALSVVLPKRFLLGEPKDYEPRVALDASAVKLPDGKWVLCWRQDSPAWSELLIWHPTSLSFGFAKRQAGIWFPTWSEPESEAVIESHRGEWMLNGKHMLAPMDVLPGRSPGSNSPRFTVARKDPQMLVLQLT